MKKNLLRRFSIIFTVVSMIFCLTLIPIFVYMQNIFTNLQLEKSRQQLDTGISDIESIRSDILNMSHFLRNDSQFLPLHYQTAEYSALPADARLRLKNAFDSLLLPIDAVYHAALQIKPDVALAKNNVFFEGLTCYYPDFFSVNDLEYDAWVELLAANESKFLPVCSVKLNGNTYESLIFSTTHANDSYLYACIEISTVKKLLSGSENPSDVFFTINRLDGTLLYTDLPDTVTDYQTLNGRTDLCGLEISVHIPNSIFYHQMRPLYFFIGIYASLCIIMLIIITLMGTRVSAKPFMDILHTLEGSHNIPTPNLVDSPEQQHSFKNGFEYISRSILSADIHLGEYKHTIHTQQKLLQARFFEKAINGQLANPSDIRQFHSYFPDFPQGFCLLLLRLWTYSPENPVYNNPLFILQSFLESELPNAYQQQFSDSELLLLIAEEDFVNYRKTLDFLVDNINSQEPAYTIRCVASKIYHHLEKLPVAYRQILDMDRLSSVNSHTRVCTVEDFKDIDSPRIGLDMTELMTLYTAIIYGNRKMALAWLQNYSEELQHTLNPALHRSMYETILTLLNCIKQEYPLLFIDEHIPLYPTNYVGKTIDKTDAEKLYAMLSEMVIRFCDRINENKQTDTDPFVRDVIQYIDEHYTEYDLCLTTLLTHFKCSSSTIRKAFKAETNITVSDYIEQKRMKRANELLAQNQMSITEIAALCGYANSNSFYKAYRRVHGHAPTLPETEQTL